MDSRRLRWGVLSTGNIAKTFTRGVAESQTGQVVAVGSRTQEKADAFAKEFGLAHSFGSYEGLLACPEVEAVYIAPPHPMHAQWAIRAAEAGKHILCEKPLAMNHADAMAVVEAARRGGVFLMEAFMYRCHPQVARLVELLRRKAIGEVRAIRASFSFHSGYNPESRLLANKLGGGGILDVGCYCASAARLVAGVALGGTIAEPISLTGCGHLGRTGVDEWAIASLRFPGDILAQLATGVQLGMDNTVHIFGSEGSIILTSPWLPGKTTRILLQPKGQKAPEEIVIENPVSQYALEADMVGTHLAARQGAFPAMTWDDTLGNMRTLDRWREAIGLVYESERPEAQLVPVHGRPLAVRKGQPMKYGRIPGVDKPVSRLVMGADNQMTMPHAAVMFDDFFERGGNSFDTAHIYNGGLSERLLGQWVKNRGLREQVVVLDKGAHTPFCTPADLTRQLLESLRRLQMDTVDIYMMHRDNLAVPVGEFIDVLNEHKLAGRIRAFGGSNWTIERIEAANRYAKEKGLTPFAAISNNFSLARMVEAPWGGCLASSDPAGKAWFARTQTPLMPWSSQARGFFTGRASPEDRSDAELVRCWYSEDNFERLRRAEELAAKRRVPTIAIALAYVLCQGFPTFPLIGPRTLEETRTSFQALELELTPEELRRLDLEG